MKSSTELYRQESMQEKDQGTGQESTQKVARNQAMNYARMYQGTRHEVCKKSSKELGREICKKNSKELAIQVRKKSSKEQAHRKQESNKELGKIVCKKCSEELVKKCARKVAMNQVRKYAKKQ